FSSRRSKDRVDLRNELIVTIDGETAKDFDDAITVEKLKSGFRLIVSIADVSFFIPRKSRLDQEALERATSIYFPGFAVPMLPEILSNNVCSLVPNEDRYTLTCEMEFNSLGEMIDRQIYPSVIRSKARLTYKEVAL